MRRAPECRHGPDRRCAAIVVLPTGRPVGTPAVRASVDSGNQRDRASLMCILVRMMRYLRHRLAFVW